MDECDVTAQGQRASPSIELDLNDLAPISVSVYTRLSHFKKCIESLAENTLAKYSVLYIFSDAAKVGDEEAVERVRDYANKITGFKEVKLIFQEANGYLKNMRDARRYPISEYGNVIRLEDDIVTAPGFLSFLNQAMQFYKENSQILNVTGYCPPIQIPERYSPDFFVLPRPSAWGIGYDSRMLEIVESEINVDQYHQYKNSKLLQSTGKDVPQMVKACVENGLVAGDVRAMFYQLVNKKYTIYPRQSLVQNIGFDGSGVHSGASDRFHHKTLWDKKSGFSFSNNIQIDLDIMDANYRFRTPDFFRRSAVALKNPQKILARFLRK